MPYTPTGQILIEGLTADELLAMPGLDGIVVTGNPIVFRIGSAEVLAQFGQTDGVLRVELAVIEGGGEGVIATIVALVERAVKPHGLIAIEWVVHAIHCAKPNPKLPGVLTGFGFERRTLENGLECYWRRLSTNETLVRPKRSRPE